MNLKLVLVIERPPKEYMGEKGFLTGETIQCLPMIECGGEALPALGVPPHHILSERFDMV